LGEILTECEDLCGIDSEEVESGYDDVESVSDVEVILSKNLYETILDAINGVEDPAVLAEFKDCP